MVSHESCVMSHEPRPSRCSVFSVLGSRFSAPGSAPDGGLAARDSSRGMSLVELLVVMGIMGVVAAGTLGLYTSFVSSYSAQNAVRRNQMTVGLYGDQVTSWLRAAMTGLSGGAAAVDVASCGGSPCRLLGLTLTATQTAGQAGDTGTFHTVTSQDKYWVGGETASGNTWCLSRGKGAGYAAQCDTGANCAPLTGDSWCRGDLRESGTVQNGTVQFADIQFICYDDQNMPGTCGSITLKRVQLVITARTCLKNGCNAATAADWFYQTFSASEVLMQSIAGPSGTSTYSRPY